MGKKTSLTLLDYIDPRHWISVKLLLSLSSKWNFCNFLLERYIVYSIIILILPIDPVSMADVQQVLILR